MRKLLLFLLVLPLVAANYGDNAPPVPSTFATGHPRLPNPGSTYLTNLNGTSASLSRFTTSALAYSASSTSYNVSVAIGFRRLLIAYLACQLNACSNLATYQAKINTLADMGGMLGNLLAEDNAAAGSGSVITSSTVNFTTACGGTCVGAYLAVLGVACPIASVTSSTATLSTCQFGSPTPTGSGLRIRLFASGGFYDNLGMTTMYGAMLYDWCYQYLTAQQQADLLAGLINLCAQWEWIQGSATIPTSSAPSPYNDVFYLASANGQTGGPGFMSAAVAIYGDASAAAPHLRWAMDFGLNYMLPVWKQIMLGDGNPASDGGGWHEGWTEYQSQTNGLDTWFVSWWLPWAYASNPSSPTSFFTTTNLWMQQYGYQTIYEMRPDYLLPKIKGGVGTGVYPSQEYSQGSNNVSGAGFGSIDALAEIYNDPVLRYWNRLMNQASGPDGFEPSAWPFFTPDASGNTTTNINTLPLCHNFTGVGIVTCRTGWTENDTYLAIRYGDLFWSKVRFDTGNYLLVHRGTLVNDSGSYEAGSYAPHFVNYVTQSIAHNVPVLVDPADSFSAQLWEVINSTNSTGNPTCQAVGNDGGQRRVGTAWQSYYSGSSCTGKTSNVWLNSPPSTAVYRQSYEYYNTANPLAYVPLSATSGAYMYMAVDITRAYNDVYSISSPNANNRTQRAQKVVRHFIFIPRGTAAYVAIYDQVIEAPTLGSAIPMKWLIHTINQPALGTDGGGNPMFTTLRTDDSCSIPYPSLWPNSWMLGQLSAGYVNSSGACGNAITNGSYQYGGKLYGFVAFPTSATLTNVGGSGHQFDDGTGSIPWTSGTAGTNQSECQYGQCNGLDFGWGTTGFIVSVASDAPMEPGSWRIEETPPSSSYAQVFLNVMLATGSADTNVPAQITPSTTGSAPARTFGVSWTNLAATCTYTLGLPENGVGGTITILGSGCVGDGSVVVN